MRAGLLLFNLLAGAALSPLLASPGASTAEPATQAARANVEVRRLPGNPIIRPEMLPGQDGENINGPSLIRVPAWLPNRLGNYYLYFAHHQGQYIRLAYADELSGPWKIHEPGVLALADVPACKNHIASPDVLVDEERHELRMYFHGPSRSGQGQESYVALSKDGLHYTARPEALGRSYFRVFHWRDQWFALAKGGEAYRSADGLSGFERGAFVLPGADPGPGDESAEPHARHVALHQVGDDLWIYYSNIGDAPERILRSPLPLGPDWRNWKSGRPEEVLRPETEYEGATLPLIASRSGAVKARENALRDPAIFTDSDGRVYLLYSVAGEAGLAIAELVEKPGPKAKETTPLALPGSEPYVFRQIGEVELRLHVVKPADWSRADRRPCLVGFFGGGWNSGTPRTSVTWAAWAASLGMVGVAPDYRTRDRLGGTPEDCIADGRAAVRWIVAHADELGVDPSKIVALGGSAGGHVAAWTAITAAGPGQDDPAPAIVPAALILLNPVTDTKAGGYGGPKRFGGDAARALAASVPDQMPARMPPTIVFHATADTTVPYANSTAFRDKLVRQGNRCELVTFQGLGHSYQSSKYGEAGKAALAKTKEDAAAFLHSLGLIGKPVSPPPPTP